MNPGYAGTIELPENLKALFRPVTMVVPDLQKIAENMMFIEGFLDSRALAKKCCPISVGKRSIVEAVSLRFWAQINENSSVMTGDIKR